MDPTPAAPSFLVGRFQGNPLKSVGGGTAFRRLGSDDSHATIDRHETATSANETPFPKETRDGPFMISMTVWLGSNQ